MENLLLRIGLQAHFILMYDREDLNDDLFDCVSQCHDNCSDGRPCLQGRTMRKGEVSLFMKHSAAIYDLHQHQLPWALILEDDVLAHASYDSNSSVRSLLLEIVRAIGSFDIISFSNDPIQNRLGSCLSPGNPGVTGVSTRNVSISARFTTCKSNAIRGTFAYIINFSGAQKFLRTLPARWHIDFQLSNIIADRPIVTFGGAFFDIWWVDVNPPLFGHVGGFGFRDADSEFYSHTGIRE
jgi:GR25 family glycosyltransferase involved in LPS biosynthesis